MFIWNLIRTAGKIVLGSAGGWIAYSRFAINHNVPMSNALSALRKPFQSSTAGRLSYYADTQEGGRPLVLLHSINAAPSSHEFEPLFEHYRGYRPVYALDLPGFGFSEREDRRYTPALYAAAITEFLSEVVGEAADVVALSLGAEFAARAAFDQANLFHSLTFISPSGLGETDPLTPNEDAYKFFSFPLWSQPLYDLLTTKPSIRYYLGKNFAGTPPPHFINYAYITSHQPGARYAPLYFLSGHLFTPGIREQIYEKLDVPVLVIYDEDPNLTFEKLPAILESNPRWRAVRIAPSLGLPHWENLGETASSLDRFWEDVS